MTENSKLVEKSLLTNLCYYEFRWRAHVKSTFGNTCKIIIKVFFKVLGYSHTQKKQIEIDREKIINSSLVFIGTQNQQNAFYKQHVFREKCVVLGSSKIDLNFRKEDEFVQLKKSFYVSVHQRLTFIWLIILLLCSFEFDKKRNLLCKLNIIWNAYSEYLFFDRMIKQARPARMILLNDHTLVYRCLLLAAKKNKVETHYIPHASVSELFPPLSFDYAWLDSEAMLDMYKKCGRTDSGITIVGNNTYRALFDNRSGELVHENVAGVCITPLFPLDWYAPYIIELLRYYKTISIRPHPALKMDEVIASLSHLIVDENKIQYSNPSSETTIEYFEKIAIIISPVSNIALEAIVYGLPVIHIQFNDDAVNDNYGFIKQNLLKNIVIKPEELATYFSNDKKLNKPTIEEIEYFSGPLRILDASIDP